MNKTIKTSELTGPQLDWMVAKCIAQVHDNALLNGSIMHGWWISGLFTDPNYWIRTDEFSPSTDWAQGGPLIDANDIALSPLPDGLWRAYIPEGTVLVSRAKSCLEVFKWKFKQEGYHPLIAAMRCFVYSKMGETVDIPEEFLV